MSKKIFCLILVFSFFSQIVFSEDNTPEPYDKEEIPESLQDLRRFEIITLGSMPFVMMDSTLVYSSIRWGNRGFDSAYAPTPFPTSSSFSNEEQMGLIFTSLGISAGIGLTDFIVRKILKSSKAKKRINSQYNGIQINPVSEDPDAIRIPIPEENREEN